MAGLDTLVGRMGHNDTCHFKVIVGLAKMDWHSRLGLFKMFQQNIGIGVEIPTGVFLFGCLNTSPYFNAIGASGSLNGMSSRHAFYTSPNVPIHRSIHQTPGGVMAHLLEIGELRHFHPTQTSHPRPGAPNVGLSQSSSQADVMQGHINPNGLQ